MSIVVPYLPVVIGLAVANVLEKPAQEPWDYRAIHAAAWNTVTFAPSTEVNWAFTNNCYINVLTAIPVFLFFGTTKDAVNEYRAAVLLLGFGRLFPGLETEYDPDRTPHNEGSFGSGQTASFSECVVPCPPLLVGSADLSLQLSVVNG